MKGSPEQSSQSNRYHGLFWLSSSPTWLQQLSILLAELLALIWKPDRIHCCGDLERYVRQMDHFCPWGISDHKTRGFTTYRRYWMADLVFRLRGLENQALHANCWEHPALCRFRRISPFPIFVYRGVAAKTVLAARAPRPGSSYSKAKEGATTRRPAYLQPPLLLLRRSHPPCSVNNIIFSRRGGSKTHSPL